MNFDGADLAGADIQETGFDNCTFRGAFLRKIYSTGYEEIRANCDLTDADISGSYIAVTAEHLRSTRNYGQRDLSQIGLRGDYSGLTFRGFSLRETLFFLSNLNRSNFTDADIRGATVRLTAEQLQATKNYKAKDLSDTSFTGDFAGVSFFGFDLRNTTFEICDLSGCDFTGAEIRGMRILGSGSYDENGQRKETVARAHSGFTKEQLYSTKSYQRRDLDGVQLHSCDLRNADLSNQTLGFFYACDLRGSNFRNADHTTGPNDDRAGRRGLPFFGPHKGCKHANPIGFESCNLSAEQFYSTRIYASKKFQPGCMMAGLDLRGWDFSNFDLRQVIFDDSLVADANFKNARGGDFSHAKGLTASQVKSMWNYEDNHLKPEPGFSLPREIEIALQADDREGAD